MKVTHCNASSAGIFTADAAVFFSPVIDDATVVAAAWEPSAGHADRLNDVKKNGAERSIKSFWLWTPTIHEDCER